MLAMRAAPANVSCFVWNADPSRASLEDGQRFGCMPIPATRSHGDTEGEKTTPRARGPAAQWNKAGRATLRVDPVRLRAKQGRKASNGPDLAIRPEPDVISPTVSHAPASQTGARPVGSARQAGCVRW
jgi:hypothetical protein